MQKTKQPKTIEEVVAKAIAARNNNNRNNVVGDLTTRIQEMAFVENLDPNGPCYLTALPAELLAKICNYLDHDVLQNMLTQCRKIFEVVLPPLREKRHDFIAVLEPQINKSREWIIEMEHQFLKRVLRTNEDLTAAAHNMPFGRAKNGLKKPRNRLATFLGMDRQEDVEHDYFAMETRAQELMDIAHKHCYRFADYYNTEVQEAFFILNHHLCGISIEQLKKRFNFLVFQDFMHHYPVLSKFTSVQWPDTMPDEQRKKLAMKYAMDNAHQQGGCTHSQGRMYEMRTYGRVGNPYTVRPPKRERVRHHYRHYDNYDYDYRNRYRDDDDWWLGGYDNEDDYW